MVKASTRKTGARARKSQVKRHRPTLEEVRALHRVMGELRAALAHQGRALAEASRPAVPMHLAVVSEGVGPAVARVSGVACEHDRPSSLSHSIALRDVSCLPCLVSAVEDAEEERDALRAQLAHVTKDGDRVAEQRDRAREDREKLVQALDGARGLAAAQRVAFEETAAEACALVESLRRERDEARDAVRFLEGRAAELVKERDEARDRRALHLEVGRVVVPAVELAIRRALAERPPRAELPAVGDFVRVEPGGCGVAGCSASMCRHRACGLAYPASGGFGCGLLKGHRGPCGASS
jgi:hypothetical protein